MTDEQKLSLDDQLKQAQIDKVRAEIRSAEYLPWIEFTKLFASLIVGSVSALVAYNQYEAAQTAKDAAVTAKKEEKVLTQALEEKTQEQGELKESIQRQKANPELMNARLVYVQFQGDTSREFINKLRESLQKDSFNAPGAERLGGSYSSMVKVFITADSDNTAAKADAERLAKSVENFFAANDCALKLPVVSVETKKQTPLEIWLAAKDSCKK